MTMFRQQDWIAFRSLDGLCRKAGVRLDRLRRLVLKELADNALDAAGACQVGHLDGGGYYVADDGEGIPRGCLTDFTRAVRLPQTFDNLYEAVENTAAFYRRALWQDLGVRVEIWLEKDALAGVLIEETWEYSTCP
jgi:hypothetical protein